MKSLVLFFAILFLSLTLQAQKYTNVLSYYINGSPTNGIKIKTNIPSNGFCMPTIQIQGINYDSSKIINVTLNFYLYYTSFTRATASTSGSYNPGITLASEGGKVVIFLDSKSYFQRIFVDACDIGRPADSLATFSGWTAVDSTLNSTATYVTAVQYENRFTGNVYMPGNTVFNSAGNVGIGTNAPGSYKLAVEGTIGARRLQIKQTSWADFVFAPEYTLPDLNETASYIKANQHLPGIPSAKEVEKEGIDVGEMNKNLLQKVEELTLYLIEQNKRITEQNNRISQLEAQSQASKKQ